MTFSKKFFVIGLAACGVFCCARAADEPPRGADPETGEVLYYNITPEEGYRYVASARHWAGWLWATNEVYRGYLNKSFEVEKLVRFGGVWTNEFRKSRVSVSLKDNNEKRPWEYIFVDFAVIITNVNERCRFGFVRGKPERPHLISNLLYDGQHIPSHRDGRPIHYTEEQARRKATEYAETFGVTNLWDEGRFLLRMPDFSYGAWGYSLHPTSTATRRSTPLASRSPTYRACRW